MNCLKRRRSLLVTFALVFVCGAFLCASLPRPVFAGSTATAEAEGLKVTASAGFDGASKIGFWAPVRVELSNEGPEFTADVMVEYREASDTSRVQYVYRVPLPTGAQKRVLIYVPTEEMNRAVDIQVTGLEKPLKLKAAVSVSGYNEVFVGVLSSKPSAMRHLAGLKFSHAATVRVLPISTEDIPEKAHLLAALDMLVMVDYDSAELSTAQMDAIEGYVRLGGALVVSGGPNWQKTLSALPGDLLPVKVNGSVQTDALTELSLLGEAEFLSSGPYVISHGTVADGAHVVAAENEVPIVATKNVGEGIVQYWAPDLTLDPLAVWAGNQALWETEISRLVPWVSTGEYGNQLALSSMRRESGQIPWALRNLPNFVVPSTKTLGLLLLAYLVLIGPANYLLLKKLRRVELTWITVPVLVVLLSVGAYMIGFRSRGTDVFTNTISIARMNEGGATLANTFIGVFAPSKSTYRLTFEGRPQVTPIPMYFGRYLESTEERPVGTRIVYSENVHAEFPSMNKWSMQAVGIEEQLRLGDGIQSRFALSASGIDGEVQNLTGHDLLDCVVIVGDDYVRIGDVRDGESAAVELLTGSNTNMMYGPSVVDRIFEPEARNPWDMDQDMREQARKRQVMSTVIGSPYETTRPLDAAVTLVGWTKTRMTDTLMEHRGDSRHPYLGLIIVPLEIEVPSGEVNYPPGLVLGRLTDTDATDRMTMVKMGPGWHYVERGHLDFAFEIPENITEIYSLNLHLPMGSMSGIGDFDGHLYDPKEGVWKPIQITIGTNAVSDASAYISEDNTLLLRIQKTDSGAFEMRTPSISFSGRAVQ